MKTTTSIYKNLLEAKAQNRKLLTVLIDPDKARLGDLEYLIGEANRAEIDYFLIGGSLVMENQLNFCIDTINRLCNIPIILFPGGVRQIHRRAKGLLLLSLLSGRNPEFLIGQHVVAAPYLRESELEILPTAYLLIDGGRPTTASYISNTSPIPADKPDIAACTAMAGEMLGFKLVYLDAGSGAQNKVNDAMIEAVRMAVDLPLIVGGGLRTPEQAAASLRAGADLLVIGSIIEKEPDLLKAFTSVVHDFV